MGLAERKGIQVAKDTDYKAFTARVTEICGFLPKVEFDWSIVESHQDCIWILDNKKYNSYMFDRVIEVLTAVCSDDMGKNAVRDGLKEIKMMPLAGELEFTGGVLTIRNDLTGNGAYDTDRIREVLEKGL